MKRFQLMGALAAGCLGTTIGACAEQTTAEPVGFKIQTSALTLDGISDACYTLTVRQASQPQADAANNGSGNSNQGFATPTTVWTKDTICATSADGAGAAGGYGIANGSITYIGTCDADNGAAAGDDPNSAFNTVELEMTSVKYGSGPYLEGAEFENPCPAGACVQTVLCTENADALVSFNITLMREANQGFFDIAVNFEDIFCSAKFDTCYDDANGPEDRISLLFQGAQGRQETGVFAVACTRGLNEATTLYLDSVVVTCGAGNVTTITADTEGNFTGAVGAGVFGAAVYRGAETGTGIVYHNTAIGFDVGAGGIVGGNPCRVTGKVSAGGGGTATRFSGTGPFVAPAGSYPAIQLDVTVPADYACIQQALNESNAVATNYSTTTPWSFAWSFDGTNVLPVPVP